ncbi:MAG: biotin--[acetyl-CoA-carboxylase] ligase [Ruminococcaceae bacterium]|nr:biotin--[acetyl-CoA-carboxylase] ligase [Oscillospiraceae bacterium]
MLSLEKIKEFLCEELQNADINIFDEVTSTNTLLKEQGRSKNEWCTVIASSQTGGKGRLGRSFYSPENTGVYFSVLLKPDLKIEKAILITTAAAVAVTKALEKLGAENPQIKWVNDIFINNKKVCGILTESVINSVSKKLDFAVLGVGVNLFEPKGSFPEDLKSIAGAVFSEEMPDIKERFVAEFLNGFYKLYKNLSTASFMNEYREKCFILGKEISVISDESVRKGIAKAIDENARLEVEFSDNHIEFISSGEISIKI